MTAQKRCHPQLEPRAMNASRIGLDKGGCGQQARQSPSEPVGPMKMITSHDVMDTAAVVNTQQGAGTNTSARQLGKANSQTFSQNAAVIEGCGGKNSLSDGPILIQTHPHSAHECVFVTIELPVEPI